MVSLTSSNVSTSFSINRSPDLNVKRPKGLIAKDGNGLYSRFLFKAENKGFAFKYLYVTEIKIVLLRRISILQTY